MWLIEAKKKFKLMRCLWNNCKERGTREIIYKDPFNAYIYCSEHALDVFQNNSNAVQIKKL